MYHHQQAAAAQQFHSGSPMPPHTWYPTGYHNQPGGQPVPPASYCIKEEPQQMWHAATHPHMYQQDFNEYMTIQHQHQQQPVLDHEAHLPSPPITVSGSEMSSPGTTTGVGSVSPANIHARPTPVRSPYEWIKKTSYQTQPTPGKRYFVPAVVLDE